MQAAQSASMLAYQEQLRTCNAALPSPEAIKGPTPAPMLSQQARRACMETVLLEDSVHSTAGCNAAGHEYLWLSYVMFVTVVWRFPAG